MTERNKNILRQRYSCSKSTKEMVKSMKIARNILIDLGTILLFKSLVDYQQNIRLNTDFE